MTAHDTALFAFATTFPLGIVALDEKAEKSGSQRAVFSNSNCFGPGISHVTPVLFETIHSSWAGLQGHLQSMPKIKLSMPKRSIVVSGQSEVVNDLIYVDSRYGSCYSDSSSSIHPSRFHELRTASSASAIDCNGLACPKLDASKS